MKRVKGCGLEHAHDPTKPVPPGTGKETVDARGEPEGRVQHVKEIVFNDGPRLLPSSMLGRPLIAYWEHTPHPFLIRFSETIGIRYNGLAYLLGFVGAAWLLHRYHRAGRSPFGLNPISDLMTYLIAGVLVGGRLGYFLFSHPHTLLSEPLALFLILAKRRDDILINGKNKNGPVIRKSTQTYNLVYINSCITLLSAVMIVAYIMYTVSPEVTERFQSEYLFVTTIFVIAGIMRYLQIVFVEKKSGSPTSIFIRDKFILTTILGWILSFYFVIYAV